MAYDKHVWQCGEAITTEKLNHMEDGIASGGTTTQVFYASSANDYPELVTT